MANPVSYEEKLEGYVKGKDPVAMQAATPNTLAKMIAGVPEQLLSERPQPNKWSIGEIIAHLAEDEVATSWRYRQMIEHSGCVLSGFDQDEWARLGDYASWAPWEALQLFRLLREANLRMLGRITSEEWDRFGLHAERGRMSVSDLARHMAGHDMNHLDQIRAILGRSGY